MKASLRTLIGAPLAIVVALGMSACSTDSAKTESAKVEVKADDSLKSLVPESLNGTINVGTDATYAPNEFLAEDNKTIKGMDVDLFNAAAKKLGLKVNWTNVPFDALLPGVQGGKYQSAISSFSITSERLKNVSMVSYYSAGSQWAVAKGNPKKITMENACGITISVQKGTTQEEELTEKSKACTDSGKKAIKLLIEQDQTTVATDLMIGKADAMAADSPVTAYAVKKNSEKVELLGEPYDTVPYGVVFAKDQGKLGEAFAKAFAALKEDGTYQEILEFWGAEAGAVTDFKLNPKPVS